MSGECSICLSLLKEPQRPTFVPSSLPPGIAFILTVIAVQLTYLPKKYHEFVVPNVRRVYLDTTRQTELRKELKSSKDKIKKLERDNEVLMKQCERYMAAAHAQAQGEKAARDTAERLQERLDDMEGNLQWHISRGEDAGNILSALGADMVTLQTKYDHLKERFTRLRAKHNDCFATTRVVGGDESASAKFSLLTSTFPDHDFAWRHIPWFSAPLSLAIMSSSTPISFSVSYRGTIHTLSLLPESTLSVLQARLEELTRVPTSVQKLLHRGKNLLGSDSSHRDQTTLSQAGFRNGLKIQMMGLTSQELASMQSTENEQRKRERILKERALKPQAKLRSTGTSDSSLLNYRFHQLIPLDHLPNPGSAMALLMKLSEDPAIKHIMQIHQFSVGVLTELAPHEHPELLGLNVNAGQAIKLRLRTDRYDGFRLYKDFKELNSKLNREVAEFEQAVARGTHYLSGGGDAYQPSLEAEAQSYILGGAASLPLLNDSREDRRQRMLEATMARLRKEEEELENSCGTGTTKS
ncbi:hypothetical protein H0H87_008968 [Tephrocybe sp. NHM501043]|nr:hypothetical protein H0H87_008968 [Tephrocybe sp. NHM501043]